MSYYRSQDTVGHRPQGRKYKQALEMARNRLVIAGILFVFILIAVGGRLIFMGLSHEGDEPLFVHDAVRSQFHQGRSDIVDRHGIVLATTVTTSSLYANAQKILDANIAAKMLVKVLPGSNQGTLFKKLTSKKNFIWLARHLTPKQRDRIMHLGIPGVGFRKDAKRLYPHGALVSHVVGLTNIDDQGIAGLEKSNEQFLLTKGEKLELSLDVRVQHAIADELKKGIQEFKATGAAAIVMDLQTSEILGMVSLPDFNPNKMIKTDSRSYFNRATVGMYEMGSTFKILNAAMALDSGAVTLGTKYDTSEPIKIGRFSISDYRANHGVINVAQIFVHSSNKGSVKMALAVGTEGQKDFMGKVGCLTRCIIEIPERGHPIAPRHWREANTMTISYGYGLAVSPLHLLNSVASVVGDGCRKDATLMKVKEGEVARPCERIVKASVAHKMRQLLRLVVVHGTSRKANVPGYFVAAKTGTRNMLEANGTYNKDRVSTTFVGLIGESVEDPRYIVVALLEDPKGLKKTFGFTAAGWNIAPIGGRILGRVAPILGLQPNLKKVNEGFDPFLKTIDFSKKKKR